MSRKIIITVLSVQNSDNQFTYRCDRGDPVVTGWTNEAGLLYLLRNKSDFTDIICLCSEQTFNDRYKNRVSEIVRREAAYDIRIHYIRYSTENQLDDISNELTKNFRFTTDDTVYIDTSGGYRSVVYSLVYLFRYFEYIGVNIDWIIYSAVGSNREGSIREISNTFRMFTLINGAHEFTSTGNPYTLKKYFSSSRNETILKLLENMQVFYNNISLCRIGSELDKALQAMEDSIRKTEEISSDDYDVNRFLDLLPTIRKKFFTETGSRYISLIEWCLRNDLLQQAITIYVEKLPKAFFTELGFLSADFDNLKKKSGNPGLEIYQDYFITSVEDPYAEKLKDMLQRRKTLIMQPRAYRNKPLIPEDAECEKMYDLLIRFRDMFYNNKGERIQVKSTKASEKLLEQMNVSVEKIPKTTEKLLNSIPQLTGIMQNLFSEKSSPEMRKLTGVARGLNDENVSVNLKADELLRLRLDYLYMKYIRNQINHASEQSSYDEEYKKSFSSFDPDRYVFPLDDSFQVRHIKEFMTGSINYIKNCSIDKTRSV